MTEYSAFACEPNDEPEYESAAVPDLGPCCCCGRTQDGTVRNFLMLPFEAPAGHCGWGCVVCHLPMRGATAIVCDDCTAKYGSEDLIDRLKFIHGGAYAAQKIRVPLAGFERFPFGHCRELHPELGERAPEEFGGEELEL